jgi:hypothetical protein
LNDEQYYFAFRKFWVRNSAHRLAILTEDFHEFPVTMLGPSEGAIKEVTATFFHICSISQIKIILPF